MDMSRCIQLCLDCHRICLETVAHCLRKGGGHAEAGHVTAMLDCVQSCITSADFMTRQSPHHAAFCAACAEVCEACAEACDRHADADEQMRRCADACRACAASCREMRAHQ